MQEWHAVLRLKHGDLDGLEPLVRRYYHPGVRAAYLITRDRAAAEDVVQEAFSHASEHIDQFDASRPFGPWFLRSVTNAAIKATAGARRQVSLDCPIEATGAARTPQRADPHLDPEAILARAETREEVWAALACLSPVQRAAIVQRYFLGMSEKESAADLACPPGTVKSRLRGGLQQLRQRLQPARPGES